MTPLFGLLLTSAFDFKTMARHLICAFCRLCVMDSLSSFCYMTKIVFKSKPEREKF